MARPMTGAGYLRQGFAMWRQRPALMALGLLPALLVFLVLGTGFLVLLWRVTDLAAWMTPFADGWGGVGDLLRVLLAVGIVVAAVLLFSAVFVGLTLTVGDPFYERIWRETEMMLGDAPTGAGVGFWRSARDGLRLALVGAACSLLVVILGFLPLIGPVVGVVLGVVLAGQVLARGLITRPLEARGFDRVQAKALLRSHRRTIVGFGAATQVFFLIPLGGVLVMPAAVVGSTILARDILARDG